MQIRQVTIKNFRSINPDGLTVNCGDVTVLVGENNCGKSNILRALDLFFHPTSKIDDEYFYNRDTARPIEIRVQFEELSDWEKTHFSGYLVNDTLTVIRRFEWSSEKGSDGKFVVKHIALLTRPTIPWLDQDQISAENIRVWIANCEQLTLGGMPFKFGQETSTPKVGDWKNAAEAFVNDHADKVPVMLEERENPTGWSSVLTSGLPRFVLVEAVKDVRDEAKVTQSNPFGTVIRWMLERIAGEVQTEVGAHLGEVRKMLNRSEDSGRRAKEITNLEAKMTAALKEQFDADIELEVDIPEIEDLFRVGVKVQVDDGFRTPLEIKGHGLQRSFLFALFRTFVAEQNEREKQGAQEETEHRFRSCLFAFEEPELYLHPQIQRATMNLFRIVGMGPDQVIFSTHSPAFVDIIHFDDLAIVHKCNSTDLTSKLPPFTSVTQVSAQALVDDLLARAPRTNPTIESMRDWYSHLYDVRHNEGFFARKIVLSEGQTEEYIFPIYAKALGCDLDRECISVINVGGKGPIHKLLRLYNEFGIPCYVVFDGDKGGDKDRVKESEELLAMFGKTIGSSQFTTLVEDQFCMFETKIEDLLRSEIEDYDSLCQEARGFLGATDSKPLIARYMARIVVKRGDAEDDPAMYVPKTIKAIIDHVKTVEWHGSLLTSNTR